MIILSWLHLAVADIHQYLTKVVNNSIIGHSKQSSDIASWGCPVIVPDNSLISLITPYFPMGALHSCQFFPLFFLAKCQLNGDSHHVTHVYQTVTMPRCSYYSVLHHQLSGGLSNQKGTSSSWKTNHAARNAFVRYIDLNMLHRWRLSVTNEP